MELLEKDPNTRHPVSRTGLSLREALSIAEPEEQAFGLKVRIAVSVPNGDLLAVQINDGRPRIRKVNAITGQGASQMGTGEWYEGEGVGYSWRPA